MDAAFVVIAYALGFVVRQLGLPPMVGFLLAGFALNATGFEAGDALYQIADFGVMLLLFTIGLKLRLGTLARPAVWATASAHMLLIVVVFAPIVLGLAAVGLAGFGSVGLGQAALVAFALSFSSTVFAVKVLEDKAESASLHGRLAIGILIMQDLFAVVFLAMSDGKVPSIWALALLGLPLARPLLGAFIDRSGHGELLLLLGLLLTIGGAKLFELVGLKPDLGALVFGVLLAGHPKAEELAKGLFGFKDLFLVGFFLTIGFSGLPDGSILLLALVLTALVPAKVGLFFLLMTRLRLRARTALLGSLSLANYSEFGLIVGSLGVANGWIAGEWLVTIAVALAISFVLASPLNVVAASVYDRWHDLLIRFESPKRLADDEIVDPGRASIAVFGMGRVGTGAYEMMRERFGEAVVGVDEDPRVVAQHKAAGRRVILGDATDSDFWARTRPGQIKLVLLAMSEHSANLAAAQRLQPDSFDGLVAAAALFPDQVEELKRAGVAAAFDLYAEAGTGFAGHVCEQLGERLGDLRPPGP